jgi:hypothetical protein
MTGERSHPREYRVSFVEQVGRLGGVSTDRNELQIISETERTNDQKEVLFTLSHTRHMASRDGIGACLGRSKGPFERALDPWPHELREIEGHARRDFSITDEGEGGTWVSECNR